MENLSLEKTYDFEGTEKRLYDWWEKSGYFEPINDPNKPGFDPSIKPFVISIPPPNVTGELHLGHAMFVSMEDLMIRYHRMKGIPTLWVPGSDHAGIATQLQVEKALAKEGLTRDQIGRDEFQQRAWAWKEKYGGIIQTQIRRLGASLDWKRERFTLDEGLSRAVREAFVRLYDKGLIYRGPRLINWSPGLRTAVSDLEVEYSQENGKLYYFKYLLADDPNAYIPVATTRPETILGDTAVAVHPDDDRYAKYVGKKVIVPILNREIEVIADAYVDREFGTGALKITPGHDPNDYEIGQRYGLEIISILDEEARINENGGPYAGMDRFEARKRIWEDMRAAGLVIKEENYLMNVPRSQRGGEIIEPMVSRQWFVKMKPLAEPALEAVRDGRIKIIPERFTKVYFNWLENIQDWCISRQLWWGHRIPVWYCDDCKEMTISRDDALVCGHCGSRNITQDPDVLDTWFSSGLWPFSTLGWPENTPDYQYYYPTSVLETGYDILFFWVARMIIDGLEFTGQIPFHTVYLHGLIRDESGQKMSKTKANVIDPLQVMDEFGTDALRFTLLVGSSPGNDMNLSIKKVESNRNFANKLWNAGRYVITAVQKSPSNPVGEADWTLADSWIWTRLQQLLREVDRLFSTYQYGEAGRQIYEFFWGDFADWYVEISKIQIAEGGDRAYYTVSRLVDIFDRVLRMLHPFTPFITEEIWGHLKNVSRESLPGLYPENHWEDALMIAAWPEAEVVKESDEEQIAEFSLIQDLIRAIRNVRLEKNIKPGKPIPAIIDVGTQAPKLVYQKKVLAALAKLNINELVIQAGIKEKPKNLLSLVVSGIEIFLPKPDLVDDQAANESLEKEYGGIQSQIKRLEGLLGGEFATKAPPGLVEKERQKLDTYRLSAQKLMEQLLKSKKSN